MKRIILPLLISLFAYVQGAPHPALASGTTVGDKRYAALTIHIGSDDKTPVDTDTISIRRSAALDSSGKNIRVFSLKADKKTEITKFAGITTPDYDRDGLASQFNIALLEKVDKDTEYEVQLMPDATRPAIVFQIEGQNTPIQGPLVLKTKFGSGDVSLLNETASVSNSLEFGGGSDGALFSLRYKTGDRIAVNHEYAHWFLDVEADLSPGDTDSESLIYGRIKANADGLWRQAFSEDSYFKGAAYFGFDTGFTSDQSFENWDSTVGLASWWFVNCDALEGLGKMLYVSKANEVPVHPLALKLGSDFVYGSKRETGLEDPKDVQINAHLIWVNRIYTGAKLPFLEPLFDINLNVDVAATWQPTGTSPYPETRIGLDFEPQAFKDSKLAFNLTWAQGEFSPTFEDEKALLAGLKLKF